MVLTLIFSTVSIIGILKQSPGCAVPITAPVRKRTPRSDWSTVYQLPNIAARTRRPAMAAPISPLFIVLLPCLKTANRARRLGEDDGRPRRLLLRRRTLGFGSDGMTAMHRILAFQEVAAVHSMASPAAIMMP